MFSPSNKNLVVQYLEKQNFVRETKPRTFWIKIFGKNAATQKFEPLIRTSSYKEGSQDHFVLSSEFTTDLIVLRGTYSVLSLCVYGVPTLTQSPLLKTSTTSTSTTTSAPTPTKRKSSLIEQDNTTPNSLANTYSEGNNFFELLNPIECAFESVKSLPGATFGINLKEILHLCGNTFGKYGGENLEPALQSLATQLDSINTTQLVDTWAIWNDSIPDWTENVLIWLDCVVGVLEGRYRSKIILVELKAALAAISVLVDSPSPFLDAFVHRRGIKLLCDIIQTPFCASILRHATLRTLAHVIAKPVGMQYFLRSRYSNDSTDDGLDTSYQVIVRLLTTPQTTRVLDAATEVLSFAHLYETLHSLRANADALVLNAEEETCKLVVDQLQWLDTFLRQYTQRKNDTKIIEIAPIPHSPPTLPATVADILSSQQILLTFTTILTAPSLRTSGHVQQLITIYVGVKNVILKLLQTFRGSVLLAGDVEILQNFLRALWGLKSSESKNNLLSLQTCLTTTVWVTPQNLAYLVTYQIQALVELNLLLEGSGDSSNGEEFQSNILRNLYMMTLHDVGRYSVLYGLMFTFHSRQVKGVGHTPVVEGPMGILVNWLIPPEAEKQAHPVVYAVALVLCIVQSEECAELIVSLGPVIHQIVSMWESKSGLNSELKGRMQQILDCLKPTVLFKEKGVLGLVQSLKSIVSSENSAAVTTTTSVDNTGSAQSSPVPQTTNSAISQLPIPEVSQFLSRHHLNSLLSTLRILAAIGHHPSVPLFIYEENALPTLVEMIGEVSSSMEWEPSGGLSGKKLNPDEIKGATIIKREKQCLNLATATLEVITHILMRITRAFGKYRHQTTINELLKLYSTLASHPLFGPCSSSHMASAQGQLISRGCQSVVNLLAQFMTDQERISQTLSALLDHILSLPKNNYGGIYMLSHLLPRTFSNATISQRGLDSEHIPLLRHLWNSALSEPTNVERIVQIVKISLHCSNKIVYVSLLGVLVQLVDFGASLGVAVVTPLVDVLRNSNATTQNVYLARRTLFLIMELAGTPASKAVLQHVDATSVVLEYLCIGGKADQECVACVLAILRQLFSSSVTLQPLKQIGADDTLPPDQLLKSLKAILQLLVGASTDNWSPSSLAMVVSCLQLLKLLAIHEYGAYHILLASLEVSDSEPLYCTFLQSFSLYISALLPISENTKDLDASCAHIILNETIQILDLLRNSVSPNSWAYVHKFVKWGSDSPSHPLISIEHTLSKCLNTDGRVMNLNVSVDNGDDLRECIDIIQSIISEPGDDSPLADLAIPPPLSLDERFERRMAYVKPFTNVFEINFTDELGLADDNFIKDMVVADTTLVTAINTVDEPSPAVQAPSPKKPRIELPQLKKRDLFRSRKPNTSRPPSVHVDAFKKPAAVPIVATQSIASSPVLSTPPSPSSKTIVQSPAVRDSVSPSSAKDKYPKSTNGINSQRQWWDDAKRERHEWEGKRKNREDDKGGWSRQRIQEITARGDRRLERSNRYDDTRRIFSMHHEQLPMDSTRSIPRAAPPLSAPHQGHTTEPQGYVKGGSFRALHPHADVLGRYPPRQHFPPRAPYGRDNQRGTYNGRAPT